MRLVQLKRGGERVVARVEENRLLLLKATSIYDLASEAIKLSAELTAICNKAVPAEEIEYDPVYNGKSEWRLLPCFDHPADSAHCMVSGTGLTHKKSAENRSAMHTAAAAEVTDSMRMYQWGMEGGSPPTGEIGVQPEWFYKGDGSVLRAHGEALIVPEYAEDGGEEPEVAGVYLIGPQGNPYRVGWTTANEFSDHKMERRNYLYLAHSKLRACAIGPELSIGEAEFDDLPGTVGVQRNGDYLWRKAIRSGRANMCHSLKNLEHHHFKYAAHRRPGDVHIHFYGADAFSFGDAVELQHGDVMEVSFPHLGRPLLNALELQSRDLRLQKVMPI